MPDSNQMGQQRTTFLQQLRNGDTQSVRDMLNKEPAFISAVDDEGRSPLHMVINSERNNYGNNGKEMIAILLNRGLDVNTRDANGATVLHYAVQDTEYYAGEKTTDLVKFGAEVEARDNEGARPCTGRRRGGYRTEPLDHLLKLGANVNAVDEMGVTPLHLAAMRGDTAVIKALLDARADIRCGLQRTARPSGISPSQAGRIIEAQVLKAEAKRRKSAEEKRRVEIEKAEEQKANPPDLRGSCCRPTASPTASSKRISVTS